MLRSPENHPHQKMPTEDSLNPGARPAEHRRAGKAPNRRFVLGVVLLALALGGLAAAEYFRERAALPRPPHGPSEALIAPPAPALAPEVATRPERPAEPPPPPEVINNEILPPPARRQPPATRQAATKARPPEKVETPAKGYIVQFGVFASPDNAETFRARLRKAGIETRIETRVQIGPFRSRQEAEKAIANAKQHDISAVLVPPR
jgi:DedD protein